MQVKCKVSSKLFNISKTDLNFCAKFDVPAPTIHPDERARRRMAFANQRNLYRRKCDGTGRQIISNYSQDKSYKVFEVNYFFSDKWDQYATARNFDFKKSFFQQFAELMLVAPRPSAQRTPEFDENSDYTNYAGKNKNCYLIFDSDLNWDCYYSYSINACRNCVDCYRLDQCELCYESIDCANCYASNFLQNCQNCSNSWFLKNCVGCKDCFGSVNLRNKQYYFFNQAYSKSEYYSKVESITKNTAQKISDFAILFSEFSNQFPQKNLQGTNNEDSIGNYLNRCKNAYMCFDSRELWDCRYVQQAFDDAKNCMDCTEVGEGVEFCYETSYAGYGSNFLRFSSHALGRSSNLTYCYFCPFSTDCFGCVGLHHAKYCILNKQYTKEQYQVLIPELIKHMKDTGEWGEFFPMQLSPFAYNESHAFDYFPLSKDEVLAQGLKWHEASSNSDAGNVSAQICSCGKNYKLIQQELDFYKIANLPEPECCFNCRHLRRMKLRGERRIYAANCCNCNEKMPTSLSKIEKVLCEKCFLENME